MYEMPLIYVFGFWGLGFWGEHFFVLGFGQWHFVNGVFSQDQPKLMVMPDIQEICEYWLSTYFPEHLFLRRKMYSRNIIYT